MLTTGFLSVAPVTSRAVPSSLFILAFSVCKSLQCLISALTQGGEDGHLFMLTCSVVLWEGRNLANIYHWRVWGVLAMYGPHWVCPTHGVCAFPVYTAQAPGCSAGELSKVGPGLCALPRSKPLRFRFSGMPQRHRLSCACVFCLSQVQAAQATRCLASVVSPGRGCILSPPRSQLLGFLGVQWERCLRCVVCLFWGAHLCLRPSGWMSTVQNPKKSWLATGSLLAVW